MRRDAEEHADEDKSKREDIELRNEVDSAVYRSEKLLKDNADKIGEDDKKKIEDAVKEAREALEGGDSDKIKASRDKLNEAWQGASELLYKAAQEEAAKQQAAGGADAGPAPDTESASGAKSGEGPVIDAEVVEDDKK
jgi:molecular chaperone DnaK